ncbi:hypothetical protein HZS_2352, partial [Henneguya salminicola]
MPSNHKDIHKSHCLNCYLSCCYNIECPVIECSECRCILHECKLIDHKLVCMENEIQCINHIYGCNKILKRKELGNHISVCPSSSVVCNLAWSRCEEPNYSPFSFHQQFTDIIDTMRRSDSYLISGCIKSNNILIQNISKTVLMLNADVLRKFPIKLSEEVNIGDTNKK